LDKEKVTPIGDKIFIYPSTKLNDAYKQL